MDETELVSAPTDVTLVPLSRFCVDGQSDVFIRTGVGVERITLQDLFTDFSEGRMGYELWTSSGWRRADVTQRVVTGVVTVQYDSQDLYVCSFDHALRIYPDGHITPDTISVDADAVPSGQSIGLRPLEWPGDAMRDSIATPTVLTTKALTSLRGFSDLRMVLYGLSIANPEEDIAVWCNGLFTGAR